MKHSGKKTNIAFFREHFFGKEYVWATNAVETPEWSTELLYHRGLTTKEWAASLKLRSGVPKKQKHFKKRQGLAANTNGEKAHVSQPPAAVDEQATTMADNSAMETDTATIPHALATSEENRPFKN